MDYIYILHICSKTVYKKEKKKAWVKKYKIPLN